MDDVVTVSIGAKTIDVLWAKDIVEVIDNADTLLYEVKRSGKNAYLVGTK